MINSSDPSITFARESVSDSFCAEILPLAKNHWNEVGEFRENGINPDFNTYKNLDEFGMIRLYTARKDSKLIGYSLFIVRQSPRNVDLIHADQDMIFIDKAHRGFGLSFIKWCESQLQAEGVHIIYQSVKKCNDWGAILKRMNYELIDHVYARRLQ